MKLKAKTITWVPDKTGISFMDGMVGQKLLFMIDKKGIRKQKFVLQTVPFNNNLLGRNPFKNIGEYPTIEKAYEAANTELEKFLRLFVSFQ